jgi:hypothetical protein
MDDTEQNWDDLAAKHDLEIEDGEGRLRDRHQLSRATCSSISNDVAHSKGCSTSTTCSISPSRKASVLPTFDNVLVDEAQDTNAMQRAIIRKIMHDRFAPRGGRRPVAGDLRLPRR